MTRQIRLSAQDQAKLQAELATADAQIEAVNKSARRLDQEIASTTSELSTGRKELKVLARAIYVQPDSVVLALAESRNLGDFLTQIGDLAVAGTKAKTLVVRLEADSRRLQEDRRQVSQAQAQLVKLRQTVLGDLAAIRAAQQQAAALQPAYSPALPTGAIPSIIRSAFSRLGGSAVNWALKVAFCESGYNPNAVNPYSGTEGLFQFMPSTWRGTPWGSDSPFNATDNALAAAWLYQRDGSSPWQCKG